MVKKNNKRKVKMSKDKGGKKETKIIKYSSDSDEEKNEKGS